MRSYPPGIIHACNYWNCLYIVIICSKSIFLYGYRVANSCYIYISFCQWLKTSQKNWVTVTDVCEFTFFSRWYVSQISISENVYRTQHHFYPPTAFNFRYQRLATVYRANTYTYIYLYKHEADAPQPNIIIIIYAFKIQHTCVRYQRFFMSARLEIEIHFLMMLVKCGRRFIDASVSLKFSFFAFWNIISIN